MELCESRILLTGATGGMGQAMAEHFCREGAQLLLVGRSIQSMNALKEQYPEQVTLVQADLTLREDRDRVVNSARQFTPNCLLNAAGVNEFALLEQQQEEVIERLIQINLTATIQLTHRLLPLLRQQPKALVVNLGSTFGSIGYPGFAAYCASKFALRGFSEALRRELADTRIKVLYIAPRATKTKMNASSVVAMNQELQVAMDDPRAVANEVGNAIRQEQEERYLGWPEKIFVRLNSLMPSIVDRALRKQLPIIQRFAQQNENT